MFRDIAPVIARQHIVIPSATGNDAVTLVKLHARRRETRRDAFQQWWLNEHAPVVTMLAQRGEHVKRYVQLHNIGPQEEGEPFYHPQASEIDGVSLLSFASVADLEDFLTSPASADINEHESLKVDHAASEFWTTIDLVVVNRIRPELRSQ
jgi:hypothetical protein